MDLGGCTVCVWVWWQGALQWVLVCVRDACVVCEGVVCLCL